jgi:tryptophanase
MILEDEENSDLYDSSEDDLEYVTPPNSPLYMAPSKIKSLCTPEGQNRIFNQMCAYDTFPLINYYCKKCGIQYVLDTTHCIWKGYVMKVMQAIQRNAEQKRIEKEIIDTIVKTVMSEKEKEKDESVEIQAIASIEETQKVEEEEKTQEDKILKEIK